MKMKIFGLFFILLIALGCKKDEPINKFDFLIGNWDVEETRRVFIDQSTEPEIFENQLSIRFDRANSGVLVSPTGSSSFIWSIQQDPDRLHLSERVQSPDTSSLELYFNSLLIIFECSENLIWITDEKTTITGGGQRLTVERIWRMTK